MTSHKINTGRSTPIKQRPRRLPYAYRDEADQQIQEMLANGIITPSVSPWSSPIVLVRKKNVDLRFCVDYRKLNQITDNDSHPLPLISDLLDSVKDAKYFSLLDLRSGYWQIPVAQEDRAKTAFVTQNGLYEFTRMPFGLKTAPATFQRAMEVILAGLTFEICLCYLDDVIVFGKTLTEHNDRLKTVLTRFRDNNLRVKLAKCVFASPQVTYLGHCISQQGVSPDPTKLTAVAEIPLPSNIKEVRTFLGLTGYYRRFIPNYATVAQPLTKLTSKEYCNNFVWTDECTAAFDKLKQLLCSAPILCYPDFDREFILQTDASDVGLGAVLSQIDKSGNEHVVAYASKTRTSAYHPQCDGQVERQNRTLQDMLSKFVSNHADDWDQWLDPVVFAYNTSRHDSTGYSPYEMIFGRTPRMPFELEIGMPLSNPAQNTEYIHSTRRTLQDIHNIARSNLADNRARQDKRNAKSTSWKPYLAGQAVWLKRPKQWKFGPTWVGPYKVLERLGVNYRIKRQDGKVSIVHHDNLKLSRIPSGNGQIVPPTPESGDLEVVEPLFEAQNVGCEGTRGTNGVPRVRPARLRQNVQPPKRYGVD